MDVGTGVAVDVGFGVGVRVGTTVGVAVCVDLGVTVEVGSHVEKNTGSSESGSLWESGQQDISDIKFIRTTDNMNFFNINKIKPHRSYISESRVHSSRVEKSLISTDRMSASNIFYLLEQKESPCTEIGIEGNYFPTPA